MTSIPKSLRDEIERRAKHRCEYCQKPTGYGAHGYHVDHIKSLKHNGSDDFENLAWACFQCNLFKGTDIAAIDETSDELVRLFNPRIQVWGEHFELDLKTGQIIGKTPIGRATCELLKMNHPDQVETRLLLIEADVWE